VAANEGHHFIGAACVEQRRALPGDFKNREFSAVDFRSRLGYSSEVLTYQ
jgi:hypothetical protein